MAELEIRVVIKDGTNRYDLLKVVRRGFDVYCIPPYLGMHFSVHESGEEHFSIEGKAKQPGDELPVVLIGGEAGTPVGKGIIRAPLGDLGRASGICTAIYPIDSLSSDFREFNRNAKECFMIDKGLFPEDTRFVEIGVWAVPERNKVSFGYSNPNIPEDLLYKVQGDPQIWIYARPLDDQVTPKWEIPENNDKYLTTAFQEASVQNRPTNGIRHKNRIEYETTIKGSDIFREYRIHEWGGNSYDVHEHINDLDQAIKRALELGYNDDAKKLEQFRHGGN